MPGRRSVKSHENEAVPTQFSEGARGLRGWGASARFRARVYGALSVASGIGGADHTFVSAPGGEETRLSITMAGLSGLVIPSAGPELVAPTMDTE